VDAGDGFFKYLVPVVAAVNGEVVEVKVALYLATGLENAGAKHDPRKIVSECAPYPFGKLAAMFRNGGTQLARYLA
jgi:hypothetical protein